MNVLGMKSSVKQSFSSKYETFGCFIKIW